MLPDELGGPRTAFPHTLLLAAGTQAATAGGNTLTLLKLSNLTQGRHGSRVRSLDTLPYPTLAAHVLPGGDRGQQHADNAQAQQPHAWGPRQSGAHLGHIWLQHTITAAACLWPVCEVMRGGDKNSTPLCTITGRNSQKLLELS